jgi:hypothetical protein
MKRATQNKQYAELDHAIKTKVFDYYISKNKMCLNREPSGGTFLVQQRSRKIFYHIGSSFAKKQRESSPQIGW